MCLIHYKNDTITFWITYWLYQWRKRKNVSFVILQTLWKCYFWKFSEHSEKSATFKNVRQTPNWNIWEKYIPWKMYKWCLGHSENVLEEGCWKACHDALRKFPVKTQSDSGRLSVDQQERLVRSALPHHTLTAGLLFLAWGPDCNQRVRMGWNDPCAEFTVQHLKPHCVRASSVLMLISS